MKDGLFKVLLLLSIMVMLPGCSAERFSLVEGNYYLCSSDYETGIAILDHKGELVTQFENASVAYCINPENEILPYTAGEIAADTELVIELVTETGMTKRGVWYVSQQTWKIEPVDSYLLLATRDGTVSYLQPENEKWNENLTYLSRGEERYLPIGNLELTNQVDENGYSYIADRNNGSYLDGSSFFKRNHQCGLPLTETPNIWLDSVVNNKYMIIGYDYALPMEDGKILLSYRTYLCDMGGNILFPEWNYEWVGYAEGQFDYVDRKYLIFGNEAEEYHYLNLETDTAVRLPEGWKCTAYVGNDYFRNYEDEQYQVYDAQKGIIGESFYVPEAQRPGIAGINSYIWPSEKIVIEGVEKPVTKGFVYLISGKYLTVTSGPLSDEKGIYYVLNRDGKCIYETSQEIIYADEKWYLTEWEKGYELWNYKGKRVLKVALE